MAPQRALLSGSRLDRVWIASPSSSVSVLWGQDQSKPVTGVSLLSSFGPSGSLSRCRKASNLERLCKKQIVCLEICTKCLFIVIFALFVPFPAFAQHAYSSSPPPSCAIKCLACVLAGQVYCRRFIHINDGSACYLSFSVLISL